MGLVLSLLGLGGTSFFTIASEYRNVFLALTFLALGISFYLNYIRFHTSRGSRIIFWISCVATLAALGYAYFPV